VCHFAECRYATCCYAECRHAESHGAVVIARIFLCVLLFFLRLLRRKNAKQSSTAFSADLLTHNQGTKCGIKVVNTDEFTHAFSGSKNVWLYVNCTNYE
jgi:hypothetical protein